MPAGARGLARARGYGTQTYGTSDPGGSRARGRARARAEQPTWAHRVRYRELGPIGMSRRKWLSAPCPRKIPLKHADRLEELTDLELYLTTPDHPWILTHKLVHTVLITHNNIHTITYKIPLSLAAGTLKSE